MVSGAGSRSSKLLGLATTRISYEQSTVELDEDVLDDLLALFTDVLLIVSNDSLGQGFSCSVRYVTNSFKSKSPLLVTSDLYINSCKKLEFFMST